MASTIGPEVPPFAASSGAFTALTGDATSTSSGGATTVLGIQGVAQTVGTATILSQLDNARTRTLAASLVAGEETVYTGAGGVTATLPATGTQNSTCNVIVNTTSGVITLAAGAGTTLVNGVTSGNISMASGTAYAVVYITSSTTWYVYATAGVGGGGGGSFTALTGDATSTATGGATTVKGINGTLLSSLATGILKNTTGTGVPSIAVANTDYAPVANPTFTGVVTAPAYSATGLTGAVAATRYVGGTTQGAPTTGTFVKGDWIVDQTATIWVCTASGSPGVWSPETPNSLVLRSATATAGLGEQTIFTGSTAAQSITFPANPVNGAAYAIKNLSSVAVSVLGGTNSISVSGVIYTAAVPYTIPINTAYTFTYDGTGVWYMLVTTDMGKVGGTLPVANGGTGVVTSTGSGNTVLSSAPALVAPTITGAATANSLLFTSNPVTVASNAATVPVTYRLTTITNNAAATVAITLTTSGATDGQMVMVRFYDYSAAVQTLSWVNTENSLATAPLASNGSITLPVTVGFQYNLQTTKWRCIAVA